VLQAEHATGREVLSAAAKSEVPQGDARSASGGVAAAALRQAKKTRRGRSRARHHRLVAAARDFETAVVYTGEAIDMMHSVEPAEAILHRVVAGAEAALARRFD
jgi:hypothetical protein